MKSSTTDRFWKTYSTLPESIRKRAKEAYKLFSENPSHPSLFFKRIHSNRPIYSIRISNNYRALGLVEEKEVVWFWIGSHADYEKLISKN